MIQYYQDLKLQLQDIKTKSLSEGQIQKIYSTAYYVAFAVRAPGKTWWLYFGRGAGLEGVWLYDSPPPSEIRRRDNFLEYFRRHLSSCGFIGLEIDEYDRIVKLQYRKFGRVQSFLWFWKGRKLYFLHHFQELPESRFKILLSWKSKAFHPDDENQDLFTYFDDIGRDKNMDHGLVSTKISSMSELLKEEMGGAALKEKSSAPSFLQRKQQNIEDDLRKAKQWEKLQSILDRGQSLEGYELKVGDQKIKFEGELNPFERRNLVFQKIKKLKRGESILKERLGDVQEALAGKRVTAQNESQIPIVKPVWGEEKEADGVLVKTIPDQYKVISLESYQIGVGLTSQGNDQLRNKWAARDDHWLHLDGLKSAHVVIKLIGPKSLSPEILNMGATVVAHFSHFNDEWVPIIHTQVKNLKGVSGHAGMVTFKKEKHLRCPRLNFGELFKE